MVTKYLHESIWLKKNSEYGYQILARIYLVTIFRVFFLEFVLELFECPSYVP